MKVPRNTEFKKEVMLHLFPDLLVDGSEQVCVVVAHSTVLKVRIPVSWLRSELWPSSYFTDCAVMVPKICDNGNLNTNL